MTHYDGLTGLPNRALLADRLRQAMGRRRTCRGQKIAVAYLEHRWLQGHQQPVRKSRRRFAADYAGTRLKGVLREGDTIARLGGDEFVAVSSTLKSAEAGELTLKNLLAAATEEVKVNDQSIKVTASIGVTFYPQDEEIDEDGLIRQADQVMYRGSQARRSQLLSPVRPEPGFDDPRPL